MIRRIVLFLAAATLAAGGAAWAAAKSHSVEVSLAVPTAVSGTMIPAGDYHFRWTGDTPKVDVTVMDGRKVVAKASATVQERTEAVNDEEVLARKAASGSQVLEEVRLPGKTVLVFPAS